MKTWITKDGVSDAGLMRAASDLRAELKNLLAIMLHEFPDSRTYSRDIATARAAIAKAGDA